MEKVLFNTLAKYKDHMSFHTTGQLGTLEISSKFDITELSYSDNLLGPDGPIKIMQENVATAYEANNIFLTSSGATFAVNIAITASKIEEPFLVLEPAHKSVFASLRMLKVKTYVLKRVDDFATRERWLYSEKVYDALDLALNETKAKTLIMTSPNYFGNMLCQDKIRKLKEKYNINIIVDAAHGAHYPFSSKLPKLDTKIYDYVIVSMHKTLPVFSGGAGLIVNDKCKYRAMKVFQDLHSTSPLYLTLLSIESAVDKFLNEGETLYDKVFQDIDKFKEMISTKYFVLETDDKTRIVIETPCGETATKVLEKNNIFIEMTYGNLLVLIVTPYNSMYLEKVASVLNKVEYPEMPYVERRFGVPEYNIIELNFSDNYEMVLPKDAIGKISYKEFGIYPPGIPSIYSGQVITEEAVNSFKNNVVFGLLDGKILTVKEEEN